MNRHAPRYRDAAKFLKGEGLRLANLGCVPFNPLNGREQILLLDTAQPKAGIGPCFDIANRYI